MSTPNPRDHAGHQNPNRDTMLDLKIRRSLQPLVRPERKQRAREKTSRKKTPNNDRPRNWHLNLKAASKKDGGEPHPRAAVTVESVFFAWFYHPRTAWCCCLGTNSQTIDLSLFFSPIKSFMFVIPAIRLQDNSKPAWILCVVSSDR